MSTPWEVVSPGSPALEARPGDVTLARAQVESLTAPSGEDQLVVARFLSLINERPDVLERTCRPGHLTASALIVEQGTHRVVVLWHNKAQRWLQPGGHADGDGNLAHVAWREATEETGLVDLQVVMPPIHADIHEFSPPDEDAHLHLDLRYLLVAAAGSQPKANHESSAVRWVDVADLGVLGTDEGLKVLASRGLDVVTELGL